MNIYDEIETTGSVILPNVADLQRGISSTLPFPPSYVKFTSRFGYGLTCGLFLIYPPMGDYPDSFHEQSSGIKSALTETLQLENRDYDFLLRPDGDPEMIAGLVGFGTGENGESLFWDTRDSSVTEEYPIYLSGRSMGIRYVGADLQELIAGVTGQETFKKILVFNTKPLPLTFKASSGVQLASWRASQ